MIRDIIKDDRSPITTKVEMVYILSKYRDDLMDYYSKTSGWDLEDALPCLDMILRLEKVISVYKRMINYGPKSQSS